MIANIEKEFSSKTKDKNSLDEANNLKLFEMIIQNPESFKAILELVNNSDSTQNGNSKTLSMF